MCKRLHIKISNGLEKVAKFPLPCLCKLLELATFKIFLSWHVLKHFKILRKPWGIFEWGLLYGVTMWPGQMAHEPRFTDIHSSQKEMQLLNLLEESSFVILLWRLVLKHLMIVRESWGILKSDLWRIATRSILQMTFGIKLNDVHSSPKERQLQKTCVSFGEECRMIMWSMTVTLACHNFKGYDDVGIPITWGLQKERPVKVWLWATGGGTGI